MLIRPAAFSFSFPSRTPQTSAAAAPCVFRRLRPHSHTSHPHRIMSAPASSPAASPASTGATGASLTALRRASTVAPLVIDEIVETFVLRLKRRELMGSNCVALHTAELLRTLVSRRKYASVGELLELVRGVGKTLTAAHPIELAIGNIVRRVLYIIRHETAAIAKEMASGADSSVQQAQVDLSLSLHKMLDRQQHDLTLDQATITGKLKPQVIEEIGILMDEMKGAEIQIAEQAIEHIYAKEIILTFGTSHTVQSFLKEAAKFRKFEVIVAESAPSYSGHTMALALKELGIETTLISDSAVFAMMPSVNKVIVGTHGVMANGGLIAHTGAANIAQAAKYHSVPFVVITGLHKLCPLYAFDSDTFNEQNAPSQLLKFDELAFDGAPVPATAAAAEGADTDPASLLNILNPAFDYVEPTLVSLFISNIGGHNPSYIYRLLAEYYDPQDYTL